MASQDDFDLLIIGCGPAGEKAGAQAAYFGKRVAVIERAEHTGGSCINTGTVPSKTLRESALYFSGLKQRGLYGIDYSLKENLTVNDFMHHEREVVEMERKRILKNLALHQIAFFHGQAAFDDVHTVRVSGGDGEHRLRGDIILIASGSKPHRPPEIAFDDIHTFDSDTFLQMKRIPKSLAVIGGGVIGCEYASIFMALGVSVTLVDGRDALLPFLDAEISERLRERLAALGMQFWFNERPVKVENSPSGARLTMKSGRVLETEAALFAAGRRAAVDGLELQNAGLSINDKGYLPVDENTAPRSKIFTPRATSSASPPSPPLPWSRAASRCATPSDSNTSNVSPRCCPWAFTPFPKFPPREKPNHPARKRKSTTKSAVPITPTTPAATLPETPPACLNSSSRAPTKNFWASPSSAKMPPN